MAGWFGEAINCREDYFRELAAASATCQRLTTRLPHDAPLRFIAKQLRSIETWTANDRAPALEERRSVSLAIVMFREYETSEDDDIIALSRALAGIDYYVKFWPDDRTAADPKNQGILFLSDVLDG